MRKWTYLVAALLMSGATATFTSCIDTDEPAGIAELRGAKAALLQAKVQVEAAEAAIKTAQAAWVQAQADLQKEKAAQEALATALMQEKNAAAIDSIQRQMKINAAKMDSLLLNKQKGLAEAQAEYDKAIAEIEVALLGYKDNLYVKALNDLINNNTYTISLPDGTNCSYMGLAGVSTALTNGKTNLATLKRELLQLQYSYSKEEFIAAVKTELNKQTGTLEGMQENLALYKDILNTEDGDLGKLKARYDELTELDETLDAQKSQLTLQLEEALKPIRASQDSLAKENAAQVVAQFAVPAAIQDDVYQWAVGAPGSTSSLWTLIASLAEQVDGKYTFPDGIELKDTKANLVNHLKEFIDELESDKIITEANAAAYNAQKTQYEAEVALYFTEDEDGIYDKAFDAWVDAKKAYTDAFNAGSYFDLSNNARAEIIAKYNQYVQDLADAPDLTAAANIRTNFVKELADYLSDRKALDGFVPVYSGTKIDPLDDTNFDNWLTLVGTLNNAFGSDIANIAAGTTGGTFGTMGNEGLYGDYSKASVALGYTPAPNPASIAATQVELTYEAWLESTTPTYPYTASGTTVTERAYGAKYNAEAVASMIANQDSWEELLANAENDYVEMKEKVDAAAERGDELTAATDAALAVRAAEFAKIDYQLVGISNITAQLQTMLNDELGSSGSSFDNLIGWVESQVNLLEGGSVTMPTTGGYTFTTTGSIPAQEAVIASYQALLDDLNSETGDFQLEKERTIAAKQEAYDWQEDYVEAMQAIFDQLNALKDQYIAALTAE